MTAPLRLVNVERTQFSVRDFAFGEPARDLGVSAPAPIRRPEAVPVFTSLAPARVQRLRLLALEPLDDAA